MKPGTIQKFFGKPYSYQGQYTDTQELELLKKNWDKIGHGTMIKKDGHFWVTQFKKAS